MGFKRFCAVAVGVTLMATAGFASQGFAYGPPGVSVSVNLPLPPPPPPLFVPGPPQLVVVPRTNVYVAPDVEGDIVFHHGYWWRPYNGYWYRSRSYSGPWRYIVHERVPRVIYGLPPGYRHSYRDYHRIHYRDVHRNWDRWERDRYWERHHH